MKSKRLIPKSREEDVLHMLWVVTRSLESRADGDPNAVLDRNEVTSAYNMLNDMGYTKHRPGWEERAAKKSLDCNAVKSGLRVRILNLGDTKGMLISPHYLHRRKEGVTGTVDSYVPGHGGEVWFVKQDDGEIGAYCFNEMGAI